MPPHGGNIRRDDMNGQTVNGQSISCPAIQRCEPPLQTYLLVLQYPNPLTPPTRRVKSPLARSRSLTVIPFFPLRRNSLAFRLIPASMRREAGQMCPQSMSGQPASRCSSLWTTHTWILSWIHLPYLPFCRTHASIALPYSPF